MSFKTTDWMKLLLDICKIVAPILLAVRGVDADLTTALLGSASVYGFVGDNKK